MGGGDAGWSVVPSEDKFVASPSTAESNNGPIFGRETVSSSRIVLDLGVALSTFASLSNDGWNNRGLCRVPILFGGDGVLTAFLLRCVDAFGEVVTAIWESDIVADLVLGEGGDWTIGNGAFGPVVAATLESIIVADIVPGEDGDSTIGNLAFVRDDLGGFGEVVAAILESDIVADLVLGEGGGDWTIGDGVFGPVLEATLESDIVADLVLGEGGDWTLGNVAFFRDDLDDLVGILFFFFFFCASFFCRARISL